MQEIEIFVIVDENGDYAIHKERSEVEQAYCDDIGDAEAAKRLIVVKLNVPLPKPIEVTATVPAEPSTATVEVK